MNKEPRGYTLFCDDIRIEVGNKYTLVGIYTTGMVVPQRFPITLPKFCLWINYQEPLDATWREVKFQVNVPGQETPIAESVLALEDLRRHELNAPSLAPRDDSAMPIRSLFFPIAFAPLVITAEGFIKVQGYYQDRILLAGAFPIYRSDSVEPA